MNGHIIVPGLIAVDYWKESTVSYCFLSHCHGDHVSPKLRRWCQQIYTSELNCRIVQLKYNVPDRLLVPLQLGDTLCLGEGSSSFQVTPLDARHCPGSIMLLFQGRFGTVLYTGDFRLYPELLDDPVLSHVTAGGGVDTLYLDNTYCSPECVFPPRDVVLRDVIKYLRHFDDHQIYIGMRDLGKEDAVIAIAEALNARVSVSRERLQLLRLFTDSEVFTLEPAEARIHLVPFRSISRHARPPGAEPAARSVALLLTALFVGCPGPAPYSDGSVQVFPYGDHSSFPELCELVRCVRPRRVVPVVQRWVSRGWFSRRDMKGRSDMAMFRTYLTTEPRLPPPSPPPASVAAGDVAALPPEPPASSDEDSAAGSSSAAQSSGGQPGSDGDGEAPSWLAAAARPEGAAGPAPDADQQAAAAPVGRPVGSPPPAAGGIRCPFTILGGRLVRLERVLVTAAEVDDWLGSRGRETASETSSVA